MASWAVVESRPRALRTSEDAMALSNHLPKLRIALLFGAALMPALSLAQSAQVSPLPKAPPEIMLKEARDPKACGRSRASPWDRTINCKAPRPPASR